MGMTFSNIHLRKNECCSKELVEKYFTQKMDVDGLKKLIVLWMQNMLF